MVVSNKIFNFIKNYRSSLEFDCLPKIVEKKQLVAFKHFGFWQCLDDINDKKKLDIFFKKNKNLWNE
jgi:glucose-1-phosphate cytidylyltransferase